MLKYALYGLAFAVAVFGGMMVGVVTNGTALTTGMLLQKITLAFVQGAALGVVLYKLKA